MPKYLMTYIGGEPPATPEAGKQHFAKYMTWLNELGEAAVSPANPLKGTQTVQQDGAVTEGGGSSMSGFTIVEVESQEAAVALAQTCPFLGIGGQMEVSEIMTMPGVK